MRRYFFHLLLSLALITQGFGAACARSPTMPGMDGCHGCPSCPDQNQHQHGSDCSPGCSMTAGVPSLAAAPPQPVAGTAVLLVLVPSLVDFLQVPPTPPPIA